MKRSIPATGVAIVWGLLTLLPAAPAAAQRVSLQELAAKVACVSAASDASNLYFEGCNVHVRDGSGGSYNLTGKGNLVLGYNEGVGKARHGAHNLVIGDEHTYTGSGGLLAGWNNTVISRGSSVTGGEGNVASGLYSSVSGGVGNTASGNWGSVAGGSGNTASGPLSSIAGGSLSTASGLNSSIAGGTRNAASGSYGAVSGGRYNLASGDSSVVVGGGALPDQFTGRNQAAQVNSVVLGGSNNTASSAHAVLVGVSNPAQLSSALACVHSSSNATNLVFEGCNVQIRDGSGSSHGAPPFSGLGNLILGYNEPYVLPANPADRVGKHNLVVGPNHRYTGAGGMVGGASNLIANFGTSVLGGYSNQATGALSTVVGGQNVISTSSNLIKFSQNVEFNQNVSARTLTILGN